MKQLPSVDTLHSLFSYEPDTGILRRKTPHSRMKVGDVAGWKHRQAYYITIGNSGYKAHRIIWKMVTGNDPARYIDHINGNPFDNRFVNLREASHSQNLRNAKRRADNVSGFKGASFSNQKKKWVAVIRVNQKYIYCGSFDTPQQAHHAYCEAARRHYGEFARFA